MSLAHFTLATRDPEKTATFFENTLGYTRDPVPANVPCESVWLNLGRGQQMHLTYCEDFVTTPFEREFGRHVAVFYPGDQFEALQARLIDRGAEIVAPLRATSFERFFFREPVNGYLFEVIDQARALASHLDQ
jgi:catechol 2,3-dioxygenase-like lactoylglutathione lyase family enzyme